jgi:Spy/CpxP family protein refolding chaperone
MKRSRTGTLLVGLTALALSAGVVAGMLAARLPGTPSENQVFPPPSFERSLADELALSPDQREKMRSIWEGVRGSVHRTFNDAQKLQTNRDDELAALMTTPEQREAFARIAKKYADRFNDLVQERGELFDNALRQTDDILTPEQQKKYAEFRKNLRRPVTQPATVDSTQASKGLN